jgi:hypothetical protein
MTEITADALFPIRLVGKKLFMSDDVTLIFFF